MTSSKNKIDPELWDDVLRAAAAFQKFVPTGVVVGGTAAALYARHRFSRDADFIISKMAAEMAPLIKALEANEKWTTARVKPGKVILGSFDGVETGIRQLRRQRPLETAVLETKYGSIRVPTEAEILRVKAWLIIDRNAMRDYLDFIAIADLLGEASFAKAMEDFDSYYADVYKPIQRHVSPLLQLSKQLAEPLPVDGFTDLVDYKGLSSPYDEVAYLKKRGSELAAALYIATAKKQTDEGSSPASRIRPPE